MLVIISAPLATPGQTSQMSAFGVLPHIAAPLRPPRIVDGRAQILCNQLHNLVLEAPAGLVREREVVGIGSDAKRSGVRGGGADRQGTPPI